MSLLTLFYINPLLQLVLQLDKLLHMYHNLYMQIDLLQNMFLLVICILLDILLHKLHSLYIYHIEFYMPFFSPPLTLRNNTISLIFFQFCFFSF